MYFKHVATFEVHTALLIFHIHEGLRTLIDVYLCMNESSPLIEKFSNMVIPMWQCVQNVRRTNL